MGTFMNLGTYYNSRFRDDLALLLRSSTPSCRDSTSERFIQPRMLSSANPWVRSTSKERRLLFEQSLFLTILVDQVCYTHRRLCYPRFRSLTMYPKFTGDCPGGCHSHLHPLNLRGLVGCAPGGHPGPNATAPYGVDILDTYRAEVESFVCTHMPELGTPTAFWGLCRAEIPPLGPLSLLDL